MDADSILGEIDSFMNGGEANKQMRRTQAKKEMAQAANGGQPTQDPLTALFSRVFGNNNKDVPRPKAPVVLQTQLPSDPEGSAEGAESGMSQMGQMGQNMQVGLPSARAGAQGAGGGLLHFLGGLISSIKIG